MSRDGPLRILVTADAVGGVWQYATELAASLLPLGMAPTIALLGPAPSADQRAGVPAGVRLIETGLPLDWLCDDPAPVRAAGQAVAGLARDFDLVQLNMPTLAAEADFPVPVVAVTHGCLATWWEAARGTPLPRDYAWQQALTGRALRVAAAVVAPTRAYAEVIRRHYALPSLPLAIHNGRRPLGPSIAAAAPAEHAFTAGRLWDEVKNTGLLDRVAARLALPFYAAGDVRGPHGETAAVAHLRALGRIDEAALAARLALRPVFVSAARFEPFGLAVLEAAAAGCPLVLSDIATFRELWDGAALFVAPDDEDGFVGAIQAVAGDPARHAELGRAAAARARRYTPEATARAMAALYARLLPARGRVAA